MFRKSVKKIQLSFKSGKNNEYVTRPMCIFYHISLESFTFTNRCTYLLVLESTKIYIKIRTKMLLHVSVCDHHQGARTWA